MRFFSVIAPDNVLLDAVQAALEAIAPWQVVAFQQYLQELLDMLNAM